MLKIHVWMQEIKELVSIQTVQKLTMQDINIKL